MKRKSNGAGHHDSCLCSFCRPDLVNKPLFPNIKKVLRNCIAVGIIAAVANFQNLYPPTPETLYSVAAGFLIAFAVEFANAYKHKTDNVKASVPVNTFFLS